jgi:hypothetical protein
MFFRRRRYAAMRQQVAFVIFEMLKDEMKTSIRHHRTVVVTDRALRGSGRATPGTDASARAVAPLQ